MIKYYGSLGYIFQYAMTVRNETIGNGIQIVPTVISYLSSLLFTGLVLSLSLYYYTRQKRFLYYIGIFVLFIILSDLQSFGRIGMLFVIFTFLAYLLLFKVKIPYRKLILPSVLLFCIFMIPRIIRGGGTLEGIADEYVPYMKCNFPNIFSPLISVFCYYFAGLYAFNELVLLGVDNYALGERNFASIINLYNRIFSETGQERVTIIADFVDIPFSTNIYTVLGEIYLDFGFVGLFILPVFFGLSISFFFKFNGIFADALKLIFIVWILYSPIYNMFSFGAFFLSYLLLAFIVIFVDERGFYNNCEL